MAGRKRTIKHKTKKKPNGEPLQMSWNEDVENEPDGQGRTFMVYLAEMDKKFPGGFDVMDEEDAPDEKRRKKIAALLIQIPEGAQKEIDKILLKDMTSS